MLLVGSVPGNVPGFPTGDLQYEKALKGAQKDEMTMSCVQMIRQLAYNNILLNKSFTNF